MIRVVEGNMLHLKNDAGEDVLTMIEQLDERGVCLVTLRGTVSSENSHDVADELFALASVGKGLLLDLGEVAYLSPKFAEALVKLQVRMENTGYESMPIRHLPAAIFDALRSYGCAASLDIDMKEAGR